jgi:hypothetical protein
MFTALVLPDAFRRMQAKGPIGNYMVVVLV